MLTIHTLTISTRHHTRTLTTATAAAVTWIYREKIVPLLLPRVQAHIGK